MLRAWALLTETAKPLTEGVKKEGKSEVQQCGIT